MSGALDAPLRGMAKTLIGTFGKSGTIHYNSSGEYNTASGKTTVTPSDTTVTGVVSNYSQSELGEFIQSDDLRWTVAALGLTEPEPNDTATLDALRYQIVNIVRIYTGALVGSYELQLRK